MLNTPLHKAVQNGHIHVIILLLEKGADLNIKNEVSIYYKTCVVVCLFHFFKKIINNIHGI